MFAVAGVAWSSVWYVWFRDTPLEKAVSHQELVELGEVPAHASHGLRWSVALRQSTM